tara:strand:- start:5397 stop:5546 length:150 start_codon:yes stop_codon:yes gene_type:complete
MMISHYNFDPDITFPISIAVIVVMFIFYGIYKGFFANEGLEDPFDDHDD